MYKLLHFIQWGSCLKMKISVNDARIVAFQILKVIYESMN